MKGILITIDISKFLNHVDGILFLNILQHKNKYINKDSPAFAS